MTQPIDDRLKEIRERVEHGHPSQVMAESRSDIPFLLDYIDKLRAVVNLGEETQVVYYPCGHPASNFAKAIKALREFEEQGGE